MLDQTKPITLTFSGILLDQSGKEWKAGTYPGADVPIEFCKEVYGHNEKPEPKLELEIKTTKPPLTIVAPVPESPAPTVTIPPTP